MPASVVNPHMDLCGCVEQVLNTVYTGVQANEIQAGVAKAILDELVVIQRLGRIAQWTAPADPRDKRRSLYMWRAAVGSNRARLGY